MFKFIIGIFFVLTCVHLCILCEQTALFLKREWMRRFEDFKDRLMHGTVQQSAPTPKKVSAPKPKKAAAQHSGDASGVRPPSKAARVCMDRLLQQMKELSGDLSTGELVREVLNIAWEYLTVVDEKKTFAQPVSIATAPNACVVFHDSY